VLAPDLLLLNQTWAVYGGSLASACCSGAGLHQHNCQHHQLLLLLLLLLV
jgi:hypothetical protein